MMKTNKSTTTYICIILIIFAFIALGLRFRNHQSIDVLSLPEFTTEAGGDLTPVTDGFPSSNQYDSLNIPTQVQKINDDFFIVDCYNSQILYSTDFSAPLSDWQVLSDKLNKPHTIAGDGQVYLVDNTDYNQVLVFEKEGDCFVHTQTFDDIGNRPHYIIYDETDKAFYAWSSMTGEMFIFKNLHKKQENRTVVGLVDKKSVPELMDVYVRSFTLDGDDLYLVSGNAFVIRLDKHSFEIKDHFPVPNELTGMVQLSHIQDYFYITISTDRTGNQDAATMIRTKSLDNLWDHNYEEVYSLFTSKSGTPYYITQIDDTYYLANHRTQPGVFTFKIENNNIQVLPETK